MDDPQGDLSLSMGLLNARSVKQQNSSADKPAEINELIAVYKIDALLLTETWLKEDTDQVTIGALTPPGYKLVHLPRIDKRGGGLAIIHKTSLQIKTVPPVPAATYEILRMTMHIGGRYLTVCVVYRPPHTSLAQFLNEFTDLLDQLTTSTNDLLIAGDFNIHLDSPGDLYAKKLLDILEMYNLVQHVNQSTHLNGHVLDLIITRLSDAAIEVTDMDYCVSSDHCCILYTLSLPKPSKVTKDIVIRKFRSIDSFAFETDVRSSPLYTTTTQMDCACLCKQYDEVMGVLLEKHAPKKKVTITIRPDAPWFTYDVRDARRLCRKLERKWRSSGLAIHRDQFKQQRNKLNEIRRRAKIDYYSDKINSITSSRDLFSITSKLLHKQKEPVLPTCTHHPIGGLAECFNKFFVQKIQDIRSKIPTARIQPTMHMPSCRRGLLKLNTFQPVTEDEVKSLIMKCPSKTSPQDPIPTCLLKKCSSTLVPVLTAIINRSLSDGSVPNCLKEAVVVPALKKPHLDCENYANYRPISILSTAVSKLLERAVAQRIDQHCFANGLYTKFQSAYRAHHSTETALMRVQNDILQAVDRKGGAILVLLDLSAAFDTIDHGLLLDHLQSDFGIEGTALNWFTSYIRHRTQRIKADGCLSGPTELSFGVPQGSVLGPRLFSMYTHPLSEIVLERNVDHHLYADDTQLYLSFEPSSALSIADTVRCLNGVAADIKE